MENPVFVCIIAPMAIGIFALVILVNYLTVHSARDRVEGFLFEQGASDVVTSLAWFAGGRYSTAFDVRYTLHGQPRRNRCKVPFWGDGAIYWRDPL